MTPSTTLDPTAEPDAAVADNATPPRYAHINNLTLKDATEYLNDLDLTPAEIIAFAPAHDYNHTWDIVHVSKPQAQASWAERHGRSHPSA